MDNTNLDETIKDLKEMRESLGSLSELMEGTQQVSEGLLGSFRDFATAGSSSTLWNAVSRFSSGIFPGFWSIQNKIRSVAVYMQYVEKKQKEQIKREGEIAKTIDAQSKVRTKAFVKFTLLQKENLSAMDKVSLKEDKYFKVLVAQMGIVEATQKYKEQYKSTLMDNIKGELALSKTVTARIRNDKDNAKFFKDVAYDRIKQVGELLFFRQQEIDLEEELRHVKMANPLAEDGDADVKAKRLEIQTAKKSRELLEEEYGMKLEGGGTKIEEGAGAKEWIKSLPPWILRGIKTIGPIAAVIKGMKWIGKPMNRKMFLGQAKMTLKVFGKVMLYASMFGLLVFLIHKSGIIQRTMDVFQWMKDTMPVWFEDFAKYFGWIFSGLYEFFMGWFNFFHAAFTGDGKKLTKAIGQITVGASKFLVGVLMTVFLTLFTLLIALAGSIISNLWAAMGKAESVLGKIGGVVGGLAGGYKGFQVGMAVSGGNPLVGIAGGIIGAAGGGKTFSWAGDQITDFATGKASGGLIGGNSLGTMAANYLVGESGPEIVSLPTGSRVTPAQQTKTAMGNNITVNVNGRLGASDMELRDIAQKVGKLISIELNKQNSTGILR